ncbi:unnamed protein product [Allacma fusca]|uniref:Uncharacterized protein n=1 Tax=Allacma fusca TaxID=39272 RepID=A0A8J2LQK6_9HEXA|nr:unnamed protein product [Allacma fusca]
MHVGRRMNRFFSSLKRKKSKVSSEANDSPATSNKFLAFRSSGRLKRKGNSSSRCQLLDDQLNDELLTSDKENSIDIPPRSASRKEAPMPRNVSSPDHQLEVQVDICQGVALLGADEDDDDDIDRILFEDLRQPSPSSNVMGDDIRKRITRTELEVNSNYPSTPANDAEDGITYRPMSLSNDTNKCSACRLHERNESSNGTASECFSPTGNKGCGEGDQNQGNSVSLPAAPDAAMIKIPKKKLSLGEFRRSAKRVRKAMKVGFVNWAQSMSYHYSSAVIPEFYECPAMTSIDCHYNRTETPWYPQHCHYSVNERYNSSLYPNPKQVYHCTL